MAKQNQAIRWYKVLDDKQQLKEGRVTTVQAGQQEVCLTHYQGAFHALDNRCPHQGGPLGEGSIEKGLLRCPWHGWDFDPCTGKPPGGYDDGIPNYPVKEESKAIYVGMEPPPEHSRTVSDLMAETLVNWGLETVFGMVGHSNLGLADALRRQESEGKLRYFGIRHEGAAAFAASAYGKLTGRPAACFAIAGPGSTNMFTGMWDAKVDRAPLLALTGQVATQVLGTGNFQELDLVRAFGPVAVFNQRVEHQSPFAELTSLAMKHALLERDVAHLTFPDQVQNIPAIDTEAQTPAERITSRDIAPPERSLSEAIALLDQAEKPVIIVGHGARMHMQQVITLAEKLDCPVLTTFKGKGQISDHHPLGCGVLGRSGTPIASWFMNESDLLLVIGASFSNHTGITPKIPTIQIDFDPLALSKFHKVDAAVWGEISVTLQLIDERLKSWTNKVNRREEIAERWRIWREEKDKRLQENRGQGISSIAVLDLLWREAPENAVVAVDVGNNAYSLGRYFECKNQQFVMSGYLGSIGFALPASMGAWAAVGHQRPVLAVAGDSGLSQYLAEITTLVKYNMPIKVIVLNNQELGKISKEQRAGHWEVWATDMVNPHFADYAQGCGALGRRVTNREELEPAMRAVMKHQGPALLEVMTDVKLI